MGYTTNLVGQSPEFVIGAYHQLWRIEKAFRMSKHDLQARPIYHHKRESIEAHLSIVFAAVAVSHWIDTQTGWSIKKFVRTTRRYRTVKIKAGRQTVTAADPLPEDLRDALTKIGRAAVRLVWPNSGRRYGPMPEDALVTQTEDVVVERRGYIYITDKNRGLEILRYTGPQGNS